MKPTIQNTCLSLTLIISILSAFGVSADTNNSSSNDQWIAFCLTTQDAGKNTDECLKMGGIWKAHQKHTNSFKILPPEVSQKLELTRAPTSTPIPLIIGHYWRCINPQDSQFESCEPVLVACTDDQSWCVETP